MGWKRNIGEGYSLAMDIRLKAGVALMLAVAFVQNEMLGFNLIREVKLVLMLSEIYVAGSSVIGKEM